METKKVEVHIHIDKLIGEVKTCECSQSSIELLCQQIQKGIIDASQAAEEHLNSSQESSECSKDKHCKQ